MFIGAGIKAGLDILFFVFFLSACIFSPPCRKQAFVSTKNNHCLFPVLYPGRFFVSLEMNLTFDLCVLIQEPGAPVAEIMIV